MSQTNRPDSGAGILPPEPGISHGDARRGFLKQMCAVVLGAVAALVPLLSGLTVFFDPLRRKAGAGQFVPVASLNALPEDGSPRKFSVIASRTDAWNKSPQTPIGAVYLRRTGEKTV